MPVKIYLSKDASVKRTNELGVNELGVNELGEEHRPDRIFSAEREQSSWMVPEF